MVALTFNAAGYAFRDALRILEKSFDAAETALLEDLDRAKEEAFAYQQSQEEVHEWIGERDEDGHILWDQQSLLNYRADDAYVAVLEVRNAFAILIYHQWERSAQRWADMKKGNHEDYVKKTLALGYPIDPRLETLKNLANTLKHSNITCGPKLFEAAPDYFRADFNGKSITASWQEGIALNRRHIEEMFEIAAASGPDQHMLPISATVAAA